MTISGYFAPIKKDEREFIARACETEKHVTILVLDPKVFFIKLLQKELDGLPVRLETGDKPKGTFLSQAPATSLFDLKDAGEISLKAIMKNNRLIKKLIKPMMNEKRYRHSVSVAETAKVLAESHGFDPKRAYRAGLLHDILKKYSEEENDAILTHYADSHLSAPPQIKHAYTAPYFLKEVCHYDDEQVLNAIYHHSDGESEDILAKILYIADKREPLRKLNDGILEASIADLEEGYALLRKNVERYLEEKYGVTGVH